MLYDGYEVLLDHERWDGKAGKEWRLFYGSDTGAVGLFSGWQWIARMDYTMESVKDMLGLQLSVTISARVEIYARFLNSWHSMLTYHVCSCLITSFRLCHLSATSSAHG